jgi:hypothetical protein
LRILARAFVDQEAFFSGEFDGFFRVFIGADEIEGGMSDHGEIRGGVVFARSTLIFMKNNIQCPMQGVFNGPVRSDNVEKSFGVTNN